MKRIARLSFVFLFLLSLSIAYSQSTDTPLHEIRLDETVHTIAWSPDGMLIAVGSESGLSIYDATLTLLSRPQETLNVVSFDWSPDGRYLAAAVDDHIDTVQVWQREADNNFSLLRSLSVTSPISRVLDVWPKTVAFSKDGSMLAVLHEEWWYNAEVPFGFVDVWDAGDWSRVSQSVDAFIFSWGMLVNAPSYAVWPVSYGLEWSPDGQEVVVSGTWTCLKEPTCINPISGSTTTGAGIFFIDAKTGTAARGIPNAFYGVQSIGWNQAGPIAAGDLSGLSLYDPVTLERHQLYSSSENSRWLPPDILSLLWHPSDPRLIFPFLGIVLFDTDMETCQIVGSSDIFSGTRVDVKFDGNQVITASNSVNSIMQIWQLPPGGEGGKPCASIP